MGTETTQAATAGGGVPPVARRKASRETPGAVRAVSAVPERTRADEIEGTSEAARAPGDASTASVPAGDGESGAVDTAKRVRDLVRKNKELQVRVRELEFWKATDPEPAGNAETDAPSDESSGIISMISDLHEELDTAYRLKEAVESDLVATEGRLVEVETARSRLEARVGLLESKAALGDQMREDVLFAEKERSKATRELEKLAEDHEEALAELSEVRKELDELKEVRQLLEANVDDLVSELDASEAAKNEAATELASTRQVVQSQKRRIESLEEELASSKKSLRDIRSAVKRVPKR
ncbi:hypothetical protein ACFL59_09110 [Planctomycetota bacterium]